MSNLKKLVSCILVLTMLATTSVFTLNVFAADDENPLASGITLTDEDYVIAEKLTTFGIVDAVDESAMANYLTRADIISILIKYLNLDGATVSASTTPFLDVSVYDPQLGAYSTLYKSGYIAGDENKMYRPNDLLTYNEAVTLIVNAMGYKMFAVRNGGYPEGYLYTANKYGLLKDLRGNGNNPIPYCDLYRIIEASLDADAVVERVYSADGVGEFVLQKDVTVLEEIYKIKRIEGIVTGTEDTRLLSSGSEKIGMYQIEIGNVIYDAPGNIYAEYLGRNVIAYAVRDEQLEYEIIYIELAENRNSEIQVSADDLLPNKTTSNRIYYESEEGKEKHFDVDAPNLSVIYNGKYHTGYGALKNALPDSGYVIGLDNSGDEVVDVLFVYEFQNMILGAMDLDAGKLYDKFVDYSLEGNEPFTFDPKVDDIRVYNAGGKLMSLDGIKPEDLLTITVTSNANGYKLINIYIGSKTVSGTVEEVQNDMYCIGGEYYELAANVLEYIDNGELPQLKLGMTVTAKLDQEGKIGGYEIDATGGNATGAASMIYGFVAGVDVPTEGIGSSIEFKIYTQDNAWVNAEAVEKLNIDGTVYTIGTDAGISGAAAAIPVGEIVRFSTTDGKISRIDTATPNVGSFNVQDDYGNLTQIAYQQTGTLIVNDTTGEEEWRSTGNGFEQRFGVANKINAATEEKFIAKNGKCFVFATPPANELLDDLENPSRYSVSTSLGKEYLRHSGNYTRPVIDSIYVYNLGEDDINVATCVLLRGAEGGSASAISEDSAYNVVTKITNSIDKKGMECKKIYYSSAGGESGANVSNRVRVSHNAGGYANSTATESAFDLEVGDVIQLGADAEGEITHINVVYRHDQTSGKDAYLQENTTKLNFSCKDGEGACARIAAVDAENNILQYVLYDDLQNGTNPKYYNISLDGAGISIYKHQYKEVSSANAAELVAGDTVLIRSSNGYAARTAQILVLK